MGVCIVTTKIGEAGFTPLSNLVRILSDISNEVYVISSSDFEKYIYKYYKHNKNKNKKIIVDSIGKKIKYNLLKPLDHIIMQIKICLKLISNQNKYNSVIFFIGGEKMILPMIIAKSLNKKTYLLLAGSEVQVEKTKTKFIWIFVLILSKINKILTDKIIVYSPNLIKEWRLQNFSHKILFGYEHILNFEMFNMSKDISLRKYIGFIGRLSFEKGIINFLDAVEICNRKGIRYGFLVGGEGDLKDYVLKMTKQHKIYYVGWINREDISKYLNEIRLLVLPSYTEGLPNIIIEAMACGTPVLATAVGSVPDIVSNDKTGFVIKDNNPKTLADHIIKITNNVANLKKISYNSKLFVAKKFSFEFVRVLWYRILYS